VVALAIKLFPKHILDECRLEAENMLIVFYQGIGRLVLLY
jgi:hypothetical protein